MIVTIIENEENKSGRLLQQADLGLFKTDMETVNGQRLFEVVKNRYAPNGKYISEDDIPDFVRDYERKEKEQKQQGPPPSNLSGRVPGSGEDFDDMFQQ